MDSGYGRLTSTELDILNGFLEFYKMCEDADLKPSAVEKAIQRTYEIEQKYWLN